MPDAARDASFFVSSGGRLALLFETILMDCAPRARRNRTAGYAALSRTSADVAALAQCAQQKNRPLTSVPCPMTLQPQWPQEGAIA